MSTKLTAKWLKPSKAGRAIYTVSGPAAELEAFKAFQAAAGVLHEIDGKLIIFGDAPINRHKIYHINYGAIDGNERYWVNFEEIAAAAGAIATAQKRGGDALAAEITRLEAQELRGTSTASASAVSVVTGAGDPTPEQTPADLTHIPAGEKPKGKES